MSFIIDLILLLILVLSLIEGMRKGFIRSVMNIITFFSALICGWQFYPLLGEYYKTHIFLNKISSEVNTSISSLLNTAFGSICLDSLLSDMPAALTDIVNRFNVDTDKLANFFNNQTSASMTELSENVSVYIADPIATGISNILAFFTIFVAVTIILRIITFILDIICKLPVLSTLNRICGLIFGVFNGLLNIMVFAIILSMISPILSILLPDFYISSMIDSSVFITFINKLNITPL